MHAEIFHAQSRRCKGPEATRGCVTCSIPSVTWTLTAVSILHLRFEFRILYDAGAAHSASPSRLPKTRAAP